VHDLDKAGTANECIVALLTVAREDAVTFASRVRQDSLVERRPTTGRRRAFKCAAIEDTDELPVRCYLSAGFRLAACDALGDRHLNSAEVIDLRATWRAPSLGQSTLNRAWASAFSRPGGLRGGRLGQAPATLEHIGQLRIRKLLLMANRA
jgi:hypothetical protein